MSQNLGFQYLWIDCLCIVQNSEADQDWIDEASNMASIYSNAVCNIAAAASSDSEGGCFRTRTAFEVQPLRFQSFPFPRFQGTDSSGPVLIASHDMKEAWKWCKGPLDNRGWILQEQFLAPRTLHFATDQLFWECRELTASEVWPLGIPKDLFSQSKIGMGKIMFDTSKLLSREHSSGYTENDPDLLYVRWRKIVELYTDRTLKYRRDKLPAISGLADVLKPRVQSEYIAGLWRNNLPIDLAWHIEQTTRSPTPPADQIAPSWSWASTNGHIEHDSFGKHTVDMECTVHDVTSLTLDIGGLTRRCTWHEDPNRPTLMRIHDEPSSGWLDDEIEIFSDTLPASLPPDIVPLQLYRVHCIHPIGSRLGRMRLQGLVLVPVDEASSVYRRIGAFRVADFGYTKVADEGWSRFVEGWTWKRVSVV